MQRKGLLVLAGIIIVVFVVFLAFVTRNKYNPSSSGSRGTSKEPIRTLTMEPRSVSEHQPKQVGKHSEPSQEELREFIALLDALDKSEKKKESSPSEIVSEAGSKIGGSEADDGEVAISPELEAVFIVYKDYRDKIRAINRADEPLSHRYSKICDRETELRDALKAAVEYEEKDKLRKELQQIDNEKQEVAILKAPLIEERDRLTEEMDEYVQEHCGITLLDFVDTHRDVYRTWAIAQ